MCKESVYHAIEGPPVRKMDTKNLLCAPLFSLQLQKVHQFLSMAYASYFG